MNGSWLSRMIVFNARALEKTTKGFSSSNNLYKIAGGSEEKRIDFRLLGGSLSVVSKSKESTVGLMSRVHQQEQVDISAQSAA